MIALQILLRRLMFKSTLILFLVVVTQLLAKAQKIAINDILATARKDVKYQQAKELSTFVRGLNYTLPLLQKVEMRFGADENGLVRNQYGIGLGFNSLSQRKAQYKYQSQQALVFEAESEIAFREALSKRYEGILQFVHLQRIIREQTQLLGLYAQKKEIMRGMLTSGIDVKVKEITQNEADEYELGKNKILLERQLKIAKEQLVFFWGNSNLELDTTGFIKNDKIESVINQLNVSINTSETVLRNSQIELTKTKLQIEKISNTPIITNLQFGVQEDNSLSLWQNPYFRLGVRIPFIENNRFKYNDFALNIKAYEQKIKLEESKLSNEIPLLRSSILQNIAHYKEQKAQVEKSLVRTILQNPKINAEITAFERLELLILEQKRNLDIAKLEFSIAQDYIALLNQNGALNAKPLVNYLKNDLTSW